MLLVMDPPQHTAYRQPLAPHFGGSGHRPHGAADPDPLPRLARARRPTRAMMDLCHDVAGPLASETIAEIMGLPHEDAPLIRRWSESALGGQDQEVVERTPVTRRST